MDAFNIDFKIILVGVGPLEIKIKNEIHKCSIGKKIFFFRR
jgi:hypothetical protein